MTTNTMLRIYRELFAQADADVETWIKDVQTVARQYVKQYNDPPLPISDSSLDDEINETFNFSPGIELSEELRQGLINLLVNHHDLQVLKPWGGDPSDKRLMIW